MACVRLGLFKAHYLYVSLGGIATHRNIYFVPYQTKKKKIIQRGVGVWGDTDSLQGKHKRCI